MEKGPALGSALSVGYNGVQYSIPDDREAHAKSMHVLSLVKHFIAINTSAKTLPQTNVISVVGP